MSNIEQRLEELTSPYTFNNLQMLLRAAGLEYILQGSRPLTLFAPHDGIFDTLQQRTGYDLLTNIAELDKLLRYHIVPLKLSSTDLQEEARAQGADATGQSIELPTEAEGNTLTVTFDTGIQVGGVRVVVPDIEAENGIIHIIDDILWPPGLRETSFGERSPVSVSGEEERS